ncbi:gamma-tubulin complex component 5 isoform X3 [Mangifera indica]|uniref:gamma-tubulin complex component 5 isoform X3 n=1 Tax=Mangifera indica TaxID=29780 RepID=UPI001CFB27BA|nr:gamma-tubulin complex component 5 isoform X3 [Mangifera indica]
MEIDGAKVHISQSLIDRIYNVFSDGMQFAAPVSSLRMSEVDLVRGVLQMFQGFSSSSFFWDETRQNFRPKTGIYVTHLSHKSLHDLLSQFTYGATCLKLVEIVIGTVETSMRITSPTLRAFSFSASEWLKRLRSIALKEEMKICEPNVGISTTLLGLANSLSSLCSGAEYLLQTVNGAIPQVYFESNVSAAEMAVHVLDYLYKKLDEVCLVQGGEEEVYQMLLHIFVGSLLPYIEGLDSWLFEGTLDDPFEEMFFYANRAISVDEADFWEKSYLLRLSQSWKLDARPSSALVSESRHAHITTEQREMSEKESISLSSSMKGKEWSDGDLQVCPLFIKDMAKSIVSAGKSWQLIRHVPSAFAAVAGKNKDNEFAGLGNYKGGADLSKFHRGQSIAGLTLSEIFCVSLADMNEQIMGNGNDETVAALTSSEKMWYRFLVDTLLQKRVNDRVASDIPNMKGEDMAGDIDEFPLPVQKSFCPENPVLTVCRKLLNKNNDARKALNLSRNYYLPPLNDEILRNALLVGEGDNFSGLKGTNHAFGFRFGESEYRRSQYDSKLLEVLFPFPTLLPSFQQDELQMSELLPFQKNSTLPSKVLSWIQSVEPRTTPLPVVVMQECLTVYIKKQVDHIGRLILSKLMNGWKLMDELAVLRAIYLLGSGDLLQHFLTVIFNKLDKGETWDDDFELNTILQESIRNSADGMLLSAPDSLVVSIAKNHGFDGDEQLNTVNFTSTPHKSHARSSGIDGLDLLKFTYKVSWPLELIANTEAIKKYNQVMGFLLKVKRAKFVLGKARRWMWKGRGTPTNNRKHHWLLEQKLLHFVDAFHQYVMDRVYHSAWLELCEGMAAAGSLDEVIEVHEAYLLSIQRQCFVVPDKLWALIASRINSILGLALDFYSIQQTLSSSGAVSAIKARCAMEIERIEKQFDDCIAFLLRVLSFKLNVGHFPHLADLVTRINYNYFYMSASGNLMTVPGSETVSSRLGKTFVS